jgi:hypothetical protein
MYIIVTCYPFINCLCYISMFGKYVYEAATIIIWENMSLYKPKVQFVLIAFMKL